MTRVFALLLACSLGAACTPGTPNQSASPASGSATGSQPAATPVASTGSLNIQEGVRVVVDGEEQKLGGNPYEVGFHMGQKTMVRVKVPLDRGWAELLLSGNKPLTPGFTKADLAAKPGDFDLATPGGAGSSYSFEKESTFGDYLTLANTKDRLVVVFDGTIQNVNKVTKKIRFEANVPWDGTK